MKSIRLIATVLLVAVACGCCQAQERQFSYAELVSRLTDLERLARLPIPGEHCRQWSSYDRQSSYDADRKAYVKWSANSDGAGYIRREGDAIVMAEMDGPGCIWRIWSARAGGGHVRIYLDGADEPAVDLPFSAYFDGKHEPFTRKSLVHVTARGLNNYTPIPFAKSCRIVADKDWGAYYHFTYSTFPKGTMVPTFSLDLPAEARAALDRADRLLLGGGADPASPREGEKTENVSVQVAPGKTAALLDLEGPRAITGIRMKFNVPKDADAKRLLRELTLSIRWDGEKVPSVWAPLGDFSVRRPGRTRTARCLWV